MIWVKYKTQENEIRSLEVTGHAEFAEKGQDIVCAACSLVSIGLLNALDEYCGDQCELLKEDNRIKVEVKESNEKLQTILNVGLVQYRTLAEGFGKYIRIRKTEVKL